MSVKKIGLVFGGKSPEHEVSIISARNIYNAIDKSKFDVTLIGISQAGKWYLENAANLQDNSLSRVHYPPPDAVLPYKVPDTFETSAFVVLHMCLKDHNTYQPLRRYCLVEPRFRAA